MSRCAPPKRTNNAKTLTFQTTLENELSHIPQIARLSGYRGVVGRILAAVRVMTPVDFFMIAFAILLSGIAILGSSVVSDWPSVVTSSLAIAVGVYLINLLRSRVSTTRVKLLHVFYVGFLVPVFFKTAEKLSFSLHGHDFDDTLIAADRIIFHADPTVWLYHHIPLRPFFVEYLQICYSLFYFLPVLLAIEMYRRRISRSGGREFQDLERDELEELRFIVVFGFCLSYIGYLLYPAIGPRFTLHNFLNLSKELPGVVFTDFIRALLNAGENIHAGMPLDLIRHRVTRDAFPSGHTDITFITILLGFKFKARIRWYLLVFGSSLIFATVYLRYHYVIDVIGGIVFAFITLYSWEFLERRLIELRSTILRAGIRIIGHRQ